MFGLGIGELLLLGAVGILLFGPKKLPELGTSLGQAITNFKKGITEGSNPQEPTEIKKENEKLPL